MTNLNLINLSKNISDLEIVKIILSSGDYFPGFYRFTLGDRNFENGQLSIKGLIKAYFDQELNNKKFNRNSWTEYTKKRHKSLDERNLSRSDMAVYELLDEKYYNWMCNANCYDILLIEIDKQINQLEINKNYFFMGSLIRFTENTVQINYDLLRNEFLYEYQVKFNDIKNYAENIFEGHLSNLFLSADIVSSILFKDDMGNIKMNNNTLERLTLSHSNSLLIASNRDVSKSLPIRFAKDIILSEVNNVH